MSSRASYLWCQTTQLWNEFLNRSISSSFFGDATYRVKCVSLIAELCRLFRLLLKSSSEWAKTADCQRAFDTTKMALIVSHCSLVRQHCPISTCQQMKRSFHVTRLPPFWRSTYCTKSAASSCQLRLRHACYCRRNANARLQNERRLPVYGHASAGIFIYMAAASRSSLIFEH